MRVIPYIDNDDPTLAKERTDKVDPNPQPSKIESELPKDAIPHTDIELPSREYERTDKVEPREMKSRRDIAEPSFPIP